MMQLVVTKGSTHSASRGHFKLRDSCRGISSIVYNHTNPLSHFLSEAKVHLFVCLLTAVVRIDAALALWLQMVENMTRLINGLRD